MGRDHMWISRRAEAEPWTGLFCGIEFLKRWIHYFTVD